MKASFVLLASAWLAGGDASILQTSGTCPGGGCGCGSGSGEVVNTWQDTGTYVPREKSWSGWGSGGKGGWFGGWGKKKGGEPADCGCGNSPVHDSGCSSCGDSGSYSGGVIAPAPVHGGPVPSGPIHAAPVYPGPVHGGQSPSPMGYAPPMTSAPIQGGPSYAGPMPSAPIQGRPTYAGPVPSAPIQGAPIYSGPIPSGPIQGGPSYAGPMPSAPIQGRSTYAGPIPSYPAVPQGAVQVSPGPIGPSVPSGPSPIGPSVQPGAFGPSAPFTSGPSTTMPRAPESPITAPRLMTRPADGVQPPVERKDISAPMPPASGGPVTAPKLEETKNPFELDRRYEERVHSAADYSWLTGQLYFVHADGGVWVLRYAPLGKEDPNGGSVVLTRDTRMESYREGDLVTVRGEILKARASHTLGGALYRANSIQLLDRPAAME